MLNKIIIILLIEKKDSLTKRYAEGRGSEYGGRSEHPGPLLSLPLVSPLDICMVPSNGKAKIHLGKIYIVGEG
jgi:hypothetical protein